MTTLQELEITGNASVVFSSELPNKKVTTRLLGYLNFDGETQMNFANVLSDDQFALIGCAVAFFVFGGVMSLSYYLGQHGQTSANSSTDAVAAELQTSELISTANASVATVEEQNQRTAA